MGAVLTADIERGVCFGVAFVLGLGQRLGEVLVFAGHLGEDVVAGSVDDAVHCSDIICRQSGSDG
ncbi:hypothetical protein ES703_111447 [subsurface metagenome]